MADWKHLVLLGKQTLAKTLAGLSSSKVITCGELSAYGTTHLGRVRTNNEDSYVILPVAHERLLVAVMDGVGGQNAGEVASSIAAGCITNIVDKGVFDGLTEDASTWSSALQAMAFKAHRAIAVDARDNEEQRKGMACTLTIALVGSHAFAFTQVGDSRLYKHANGQLAQVSRDQTVTNALIESGRLNLEDALHHPDRNKLEFALGLESADNPLQPEEGFGALAPGDSLLLCSDGLTDMVEDTFINKQFNGGGNSLAVTHALVKKALSEGGKDNITVITVQRSKK